MKSGIFIIDKEQGKTSRDIVNEVCRKFQTKKVGHTGTLDPLATGVLVVAVNEGTKIIEFLMSDEKEYIAEVIVGVEMDTLDITGNVLRKEEKNCSKEEIEQVLHSFLGKYEQEVPKYSAVHVDGKRLYEYAREEKEVLLPKRLVEIKDIELLNCIEEYPQKFTFRVSVSKGTYIRSLIRDIGIKLGVCCSMSNLRRIRQGSFLIKDAKKIEELKEEDLFSIREALSDMPQKIIEDETKIKKIRNGAKLSNEIEEDTCFLDSSGNVLAIYEKQGDTMKPRKVFVYKTDV